jgi:hypothetical protein
VGDEELHDLIDQFVDRSFTGHHKVCSGAKVRDLCLGRVLLETLERLRLAVTFPEALLPLDTREFDEDKEEIGRLNVRNQANRREIGDS